MENTLSYLAATPLDVFVIVFNVCLATAIVISNAILIGALLNSKGLLKHNNYIFIFSLTVSDFIMGAGWFYNGVFDVRDNLGSIYSASNVFPTIHGISLLTMLSSMVDRYYAVSSPFSYSQKMTRARVLMVVLWMWLWPFLTAFGMAFVKADAARKYQGYTTIAVTVCLLVIMTVVNLRLYFITKRQLSRGPANDEESKKKSARLIIVASTVFIAFWLPSLINSSVCGGFGLCFPPHRNNLNPVNVIRMFNTLSSPIIFLVGSTLLRNSIKNLARRLLCKRSVHPNVGARERKDGGGSMVAVVEH
uniref:Trace amine-associated receptor 1-like isoform X1 n=2 Tax=Petromyzon marinus TaxID=7757 RepID=A0AAJ7SP56_PETMA|nr:trace amine-associated receptor 1-like isoform X1 [Petromyzon marinus]